MDGKGTRAASAFRYVFVAAAAIVLITSLVGCDSGGGNPVASQGADTSTAVASAAATSPAIATPTSTPTPTATPLPTQAPPAATQAPPAATALPVGGSGCYIDPEGNCYRAGEFCPNALHGQTIQGESGPLKCEDVNGWRWESA